jgi:hypothetical protein
MPGQRAKWTKDEARRQGQRQGRGKKGKAKGKDQAKEAKEQATAAKGRRQRTTQQLQKRKSNQRNNSGKTNERKKVATAERPEDEQADKQGSPNETKAWRQGPKAKAEVAEARAAQMPYADGLVPDADEMGGKCGAGFKQIANDKTMERRNSEQRTTKRRTDEGQRRRKAGP